MKKILRKPISFLLAFVLLFSTMGLSSTVFAVGAVTEIKFGEVEGKIGNEVIIPVTISENSGISTFFFVVEYDAQHLTFVSAERGAVLTDGTFTFVNNATNGELSLAWFTVNRDISANGIIMNLKFKINDNAKGDYNLNVRYLPQDIVNASYAQVDCVVTNGKIFTGSTISGTITSFGEATAPVTLQLLENSMEISTVTTTDGIYSFNSVAPGTYTIIVKKSKHATGKYEITVENADIIKNLQIYLFGDATGDGMINGFDIIRLKKYLANYDETTGASTVEVAMGADATGDDNINGFDIIRLKKYLANYDETTDASTVVLGPAN